MIKAKLVSGDSLRNDVVREGQSERRFSLLLIFLLAWVYLQIIAVVEPLPEQFLRIALQFKNPIAIIVAIVGTLLYFKQLKINKYAVLPLIFSGFALFSVFVSSIRYTSVSLNELYLVLMYFLWSWVMFVLGPVVFNSDEKIKTFLNWAITGTILIFLIGLFWGLFIGIDMAQAFGGSRAGAERYSFGFRNVGYIGSILVSIVAGAMLLYVFSTNKQMRVIWVVTVILFLIAMVMTDSRSYMVFIAIVWFVYITLNSRHAPLVIYIGVFGLIAIFIWFDRTFLIAENPIQQINYYSSGRIFIWEATIRNTMSSMTTIFLGHGIAQGWTTTLLTISGDTIIKPFQRFAVDNIFIELFSLYGLIGLILFLWAIFRVIKVGIIQLRSREQDGSTKSQISLAIGIIVAMLVSGTTSSTMPSMGNLLNAILLFICIPIIINSTGRTSLYK